MRFVSAVTALIVALATPAVSVAHAHAHHEASEHVHQIVTQAAVDGNAVGTTEQDGHGHSEIGPSVCNRILQLLPVLSPPAASVTVAITLSASASRIAPTPFESPPRVAHTLLAQPRAPPIL